MKTTNNCWLVSLPFAWVLLTGVAHAGPNLVVNGDFETTTATSSVQMTATNVASWSTGGYNFLFLPGAGTSGTTADTTGATGQYGGLNLWGPGNGSSNGLSESPTGGNFVAADGAFQQGAISQTISNLVVGVNYLLSFYWAAAQQSGFTGPTTEMWGVSLGAQTINTATASTPSQGFIPWTRATMVFSATATSETLAFLAAGTPGGQPPFSLLDGVSLVAAPEPAGLTGLVVGLAAMLMARRRTRSSLLPAQGMNP